MILKFNIKGLSLLELNNKYGLGEKGFYDNDWWLWLKEDFAKEKSEAGIYEIDFNKDLNNLNYDEQKKEIKEGWYFCHPAILAEAILSHCAETGKRLMEDWYSRTSTITSDGDHVYVGNFDSRGLLVNDGWNSCRYDSLGVSSARKLKSLKSEKIDTFDNLSIEISEIKINGKIYRIK